MLRLDQLGIHLPDYNTHLATSYWDSRRESGHRPPRQSRAVGRR